MIRILCQRGGEGIGQEIAQSLVSAYEMSRPAEVLIDDEVGSHTPSPEGEDVLLLVYQSRDLARSAQAFLQAYREAHAISDPRTNQRRPGGVMIPVATNPTF